MSKKFFSALKLSCLLTVAGLLSSCQTAVQPMTPTLMLQASSVPATEALATVTATAVLATETPPPTASQTSTVTLTTTATIIETTSPSATATNLPPTAVPPTAVPPTAVPPTAVPPTAVPTVADPNYAPQQESVWDINVTPDSLTGTCSSEAFNVPYGLVAITPQGNALLWKDAGPAPYTLYPYRTNVYGYEGRSAYKEGNLRLVIQFTSATSWVLTSTTTLDADPQCQHIHQYTATLRFLR